MREQRKGEHTDAIILGQRVADTEVMADGQSVGSDGSGVLSTRRTAQRFKIQISKEDRRGE